MMYLIADYLRVVDGNTSVTYGVRAVPEPGILFLFGAGLLGLFGMTSFQFNQRKQ